MRVSLVIAALLLTASAVGAQIISIPFGGPPRVRPSPNAALLGSPASVTAAVARPDRPSAMSALDPSRHPVEALDFLGLLLGTRVLDATAGTGYYSEIIGNAVGPGGAVTALILPGSMQEAAYRATISGVVGRVPNVSLRVAAPAAVSFAANSFDFVLIYAADQSSSPNDGKTGRMRIDDAVFLRKIYAALRPGGVVGVIDQVNGSGGDASVAASPLPRVDATTVKADFRRAGFVFDSESALAGPPGNSATRGETDCFVFRFVRPE